MSTAQTWRNQTERRFRLDRPTAERVLAVLTEELPQISYVQGSSTTLVATTYLDTIDRVYYRAVAGGSGRQTVKVRVREYLPLDDRDRSVLSINDHCYLERKQRREHLRFKERIELPKTRVAEAIDGRADHLTSDTAVAELHREVTEKQLVPILLSQYERRVWGSDTQLRVTFDERLRFYRPPPILYGRPDALDPELLGAPAALGPPRILEVKQSASDTLPSWLEQLLSELPASDDYSKFANGMRELDRTHASVGSLTRPVIAIK